MKKRIFSILLTIAVCLSMMPAGVWANEGNIPEKGTDNLFKINTVEEFKTFQNKVNRGGTDKTVTLSTNSDESEVSIENGHTNHCVCGGTANVNGHIHSAALDFQPWTETDKLPDEGTYYLTESVTISNAWSPTGEVVLCLNGQTISGSITVGTGATLTLTDCTNQGSIQGNNSTGITINGGTFNMYSGTITGFTNGVQVGLHSNPASGSTFNMYAGKITNNISGGGVFLVGTTNSNMTAPSFIMHGGTISNNTAGASDGGGGGVYVGEKCSFTMDGGNITGNTATAGNGGGIYIHYNAGNVSISNGTITGNTATGEGVINYGGGIYSAKALTVSNATITGNIADEGGGIYGKGSITLTDATVTDNNRYDVYLGVQDSDNAFLTVSGLVNIGYYANYAWKLPIHVSGALDVGSVIRVGVYEGIKPAYGSPLPIAEPTGEGVTLNASNFNADAEDCVTSLGEDGKVYLARCAHEMDDTGYTCRKCKTQFDARVGESDYYQTLNEAFSEAKDGTVTLLRDVTLHEQCSAAYDNNMTLDLNGKTISSDKAAIGVGDGKFVRNLTVKDSSESGGTQVLNVKLLVRSNGTLAVDNSYTGDISCVTIQGGGALERFSSKIGELVLQDAATVYEGTGGLRPEAMEGQRKCLRHRQAHG